VSAFGLFFFTIHNSKFLNNNILNFSARTKHTQEVVDKKGSKKELIIEKSTIGIGVSHQHVFLFQSPDHNPHFPKLVSELSDIVAKYNATKEHTTTCRGTQLVLYFGKYWPKGAKGICDCKANAEFPEFYEALKKASIWQYITNFLCEKYPQQWKILYNLPDKVHIFGLFPFLAINYNHLSAKHYDQKDSEFINCFIIPFGIF
jgi:hypothetical protein